MLVATRDPMPQHGRHDAAVAHAHAGSRATRLMFVLQLAGSLLAIPVGLASGYSIYRTNFSPETTCQTLRGNIIGMIDKQIDATTRRMLVRRDVETFEKTCGAVDPDAEAAFKSLLASETAPALRPGSEALDAMPAHAWRKTETPANPVKETKAKDSKDTKDPERVAARSEEHEPSSDARWLDAVRSALTTHETERGAQEATVKPLVVPAMLRSAPTEPPIQMAPVLPPPSSIAAPPSMPARGDDHPVPPAAIPDRIPEQAATGSIRPQMSWLDHLPLIGR